MQLLGRAFAVTISALGYSFVANAMGLSFPDQYYPLWIAESFVTEDKAMEMDFDLNCWSFEEDVGGWYKTPLNDYISVSKTNEPVDAFVIRFYHLKLNLYVFEIDFSEAPPGFFMLLGRIDADGIYYLESKADDSVLEQLLTSHRISGKPSWPAFEVSEFNPDALVGYMLEVSKLPSKSTEIAKKLNDMECRSAANKK